MSELKKQLDVCLANTFAMYLKAQTAHWNVQGPEFYQFHELFGDIYNEVWGAVDTIAELIRTLDELAVVQPVSTIAEYANETGGLPNAWALLQANDAVLASLMIAYKLAEDDGELGISNALQDRITAHQKHKWMLKATMK